MIRFDRMGTGFLLWATILPTVAVAQESPVWSFRDLDTATRQLTSLTGLSGAEREQVRSIQASIGELQEKFRTAFPGTQDAAAVQRNLPQPFRESIAADLASIRMLNQTGEARPSASKTRPRRAILEELSADLALKAKFGGSGFGLGGGFPAVVKVTVETVRQGKKEDGLWVRANPRRYGVTSDPMFVFNSATSPTATNLPPGLFVLWDETADHHVIASQPVEIGSANKDSELIRFSLP